MMQIAESSVQAGNRRGCDVPWHDKLIAADRWEPLMTVNSIYSSVVGSLVVHTPVDCHSKFVLDSLRNIQPVQLGVKQACQAVVKLPTTNDDMNRAC